MTGLKKLTGLKRLLAVLMLFLALGLSGAALAGPLDDAKAAGWLGERSDGYLGILAGAPAGAGNLARDINTKRRAKYIGIANSNGTSLQAVEMLVGGKLIARAKSGEFVMNAGGQWMQK